MGNTKHICYCRGGKAHCKRLNNRDKMRNALDDWDTLTGNLERYLAGDACVGEPSEKSNEESGGITQATKGFADAVERLADSRLRNDHQQAIVALRSVGEILATVLHGTTRLLADERIKAATSPHALSGQPISSLHRRKLRHATELLTTACERSVQELAEAVNQQNSGSIIHHTALVSDVIYEMLNIALFPIPQCEVATEELLPEDHPHRGILKLDHTHEAEEKQAISAPAPAQAARQKSEDVLREAAVGPNDSVGDAIVKMDAAARRVLNRDTEISIEPFGFTLRERAPSNQALDATGTVTTRCTFNPWDGCIGYPDW